MNIWDENNQNPNNANPEDVQELNTAENRDAEQHEHETYADSTAQPQENEQVILESDGSGSHISEEPQDSKSMENDYAGSYSSYQQQYTNPQQPQYGGSQYTGGYPYQNPYHAQQSNPYNVNQYQGGMYNNQQYNGSYQGYPQNQNQYQQGQPYYQSSSQPPMDQKPPVKKKKTGKIIFACLLAAAIISAGIGVVYAVRNGVQAKPESTTTTTSASSGKTNGETKTSGNESLNVSPTPAGDTASGDQSGKLSAEQVYEKLSKSNVGIVIYSADGNTIMGQGSGIIMSQSGYILTCAHVIDEVSNGKIRIVLEDNTEYDAAIVGYDERTDIGVVKITPTGTLNVAEFGDSNALKVGEQIIAIGNPGGLQFFGSFSDGKVSAIDRPVNSSIGYTMKCIQHTAAISPGNSGGMLVNLYGQVIGINSSKIAQTDYEGIGFAIPISSAKPIIDDIIEYGYVKDRAKLGISYNKINANYQYYMAAYSYGMPTGSIVIESISEDSDINNYDVRQYDFITAINGKELQDGSELTEFIENSKPGDKVTLTISRISNNAIKTFDITCELVEDKGTADSSSGSTNSQNGNNNNPNGGNNPFGSGQNPFGFPGY